MSAVTCVCVQTRNRLNKFCKSKFTITQTANERAGKNSGCMLWPGSTFPYNGTHCTFWQELDPEAYVPLKERVDTVMRWFTDKKTPVNFAVLYIDEPDGIGHRYSPDSKEVCSWHSTSLPWSQNYRFRMRPNPYLDTWMAPDCDKNCNFYDFPTSDDGHAIAIGRFDKIHSR